VAWLNRLMKCIVIGLLMFEIELICQFIYTLGQVQKRGVVKSAIIYEIDHI
jgi:hypothetical protein